MVRGEYRGVCVAGQQAGGITCLHDKILCLVVQLAMLRIMEKMKILTERTSLTSQHHHNYCR